MALTGLGYTEGVGKNVASDTISGKEFQVVKIALGAEGSLGGFLDDSNPMPVDTGTADPSTETKQDASNVLLAAIQTLLTAANVDSTTLLARIPSSLTAGGNFKVSIQETGTLPVFKIGDGVDTADVFDLTNSNPLAVALVDSSGTQITSLGGGGTQYTEGDTDSTITGTAMLWEDTSETLRSVSVAKPLPVNIVSGAGSGGTAMSDGGVFTPNTTSITPTGGYRDDVSPSTVAEGNLGAFRITTNRALHVNQRAADGTDLTSATDGLLVNLGANNDVTVTGTVTANAGTNLSTSLLALESGGNLATAVASLSVMDDWDETDRAKVNVIVGQAGITAGAGAVAANTPRVTHASDDPVTTSVQLIDDAIVADDAPFTPATTKLMMAGFTFDDVTPDSVNEGDAGAARMSANRNVYTTIRDAAGNERGLNIDASGNLTANVTGTVTVASHAVTNAGSFATQVTDVIPGVGATNLGKAEDAVHGSGDTGVMALAVRRDANTSLVTTDGDYAPFQVDATGSLKVAITAGAGSGGTSIADDAAFTVGSTSLTPVGGTYKSTLDLVDDGDAGAFHMTQRRALHVNLRDTAGNELSVGGGTQYDEDAASAGAEKLTLAGAVRQDTIASSTTTDGDYANLKVNSVGRLYTTSDITGTVAVSGTFWQATQPVSGTVAVSGAVTVAAHAVTNAGTFAVQADSVIPGTGATNLGKAEDAVHTSGDVGVMGLAVRRDADTTLVTTDGDYAPLQVNAAGSLKVAITAGAGSGGTSIADGAVFTPDTTSLTVMGGYRDDTSPATVTEGDAAAFRMTQYRAMHACLHDSTGAELALGSVTQYTEGDTDSTISGQAILWEDTSDTLRAVSAAKPLPVAIISGAGSGGTAMVDDAAFTVATTSITPVGGTYKSTLDLVDDGDGGAFHMTQRRALHVNLRDSSGAELSVGGGTQYDEDAASAGAEKLTLAGAIRQDTIASSTTTDGDYANLKVNNVGRLYTTSDITGTVTVASHAVTNAGTFAVQDSEKLVDNAPFTDGTTKLEPGGYIYDEVAGTALTENDIAAARINVNRAQVNVLEDGATRGRYATVSAANALKVDGSAVTQPVSGTFWQATQPVSGTVAVSGTVTVDSELPAAAALADNTANPTVPAVGSFLMAWDGTNWDRVQTGAATGGALKVDGSAVTQPVSGTFWQATQPVSGTVAISTLPATPAGTNNIGDVDVLTVPADPFGLNADAASATGSISAKLKFIAQTGIPVTGTVTVGSHAVTNAGTFVVQENGAALTALQLIDDPVFADDAAFTPGTSKVMMAGFQADETATDSVDEGDAGAARMTLDRKQIVTPQPHSGGGCSIFRSLDLDEGTLEVVKASPGCLYGGFVTNRATSTRWIKFYNATSGTIGTGTPVLTMGIPGNATDNIAANLGLANGMGVGFSTGICVGASTGFADADTGAPGTNDIVINLLYQ